MSKFSQALDETLKHFNITGKALAEASGLTEQAVSKFRRGEREIQVNNLERLIEALPKEARNYLFFRVLIQGTSTEDLSAFLHAIAHKMRTVEKDTPQQPELVLG